MPGPVAAQPVSPQVAPVPRPASGDITGGIVLMIAFALVAPGIDILAKLAARSIPPGEIAAARFAVQAAVLMPLALIRGNFRPLTLRSAIHHMLRGLLIGVAIVCFITAIRVMPIADAIAIFFVEPMILTVLGGWVLGESVGWRRYAACAAGFAGALIVVQPSYAVFGWVAALPLVTALSFSVYLLLTRTLAQRDDPYAMQAYAGLAAAVFIGGVLWLGDGGGSSVFDPVWPNAREALLVFGVGAIATFSHLLVVFAFSRAPASTLAPLQYMEIVSATILSFLVFGDFPDPLKWLGIAIIVGSGLFIFWRERAAERRGAAA
ncbi:MAG: DMT family transporter [Paracoccaceae bacterium]